MLVVLTREAAHNWTSVTGCGGELRGVNGTFTSPGYPNSYSHSRTCEWLITVNTNYSVQLTITDFDMENSQDCSYDALEVKCYVPCGSAMLCNESCLWAKLSLVDWILLWSKLPQTQAVIRTGAGLRCDFTIQKAGKWRWTVMLE